MHALFTPWLRCCPCNRTTIPRHFALPWRKYDTHLNLNSKRYGYRCRMKEFAQQRTLAVNSRTALAYDISNNHCFTFSTEVTNAGSAVPARMSLRPPIWRSSLSVGSELVSMRLMIWLSNCRPVRFRYCNSPIRPLASGGTAQCRVDFHRHGGLSDEKIHHRCFGTDCCRCLGRDHLSGDRSTKWGR